MIWTKKHSKLIASKSGEPLGLETPEKVIQYLEKLVRVPLHLKILARLGLK